MIFLLVGFGFLSGVTMVLFGFGGGFVAVPLIYRLTLATHPAEAMHVAVATSTAVMIFNALFSTYRHRERVAWSSVFPLALYIALGAALKHDAEKLQTFRITLCGKTKT